MSDEIDRVEEQFEATLAGLRPVAARADPIAAAYAAGLASGKRGLSRWRAAAAAAAIIAASGPWRSPVPPAARPPAATVVDQPAHLPPLPQFFAPADMVRVEKALLDRGLDGLPPAPPRAVFPVRVLTF